MKPWQIALIVVGALLLVLIVVFIILNNKKKVKKIKVDDSFIDQIINNLGGITNITEVLVDNARLKIKVKDIKTPNFEALKEMSGQGVFITGSYIKVLFKFDSVTIKKQIEERM